MSEKSAFKALYTEMVASNGDFSKVNAKYKKSIKVYVKESFPHFLISDGYFYVPAYFTKEAVKEFKDKSASVHIVDLADKVIVLNKWTLETRKAGNNSFGSYDGVEIRLNIQSFKTSLQDKLNPVRYPSNLFRDNEMKTIIQHYKHECLQKALSKSKGESLPDISKVSSGKDANWGKNGTVTIKSDAGFKEGSTHSVELKDIFVQEKGAQALKKRDENTASSAPKVSGGKNKRAAKSASKKSNSSSEVKKVLKFTPKKDGKNSNKASVAGKKHTMPSPHGKKSVKTTEYMTMEEFKEFLQYNKKKGGKNSTRSGKHSKK